MRPWSSTTPCSKLTNLHFAFAGWVGAWMHLAGSVLAAALPPPRHKTALRRKPTPAQGQRSSGAEGPGLQGLPWQCQFAGAPLSSQHSQLSGVLRSFSQGLFHLYGCFGGSGQPLWRGFLPRRPLQGVHCRAGHANLAKQAETCVMKGTMSPSLPPFQLQLLLFCSQEVASPECTAFPAPRSSWAVITQGNRACFLPQFHPAPFVPCFGSPWGPCPAPEQQWRV